MGAKIKITSLLAICRLLGYLSDIYEAYYSKTNANRILFSTRSQRRCTNDEKWYARPFTFKL